MAEEVDILRSAAEDQLAVIGMGVDFPGFQTLDGFLDAIYRGKPVPVSNSSWQAEGSMSRAAACALRDCAWEGAQHQVIGSLVIGASSEISQFNTQTEITGPVSDFAGYSEPLPAMLVQAHEWLAEHEVEAVILAGSHENGSDRQPDVFFGFDQSVHAAQSGSGAAAVVIMRNSDAQRLGLKVYAVIEALAFTGQSNPDALQDKVSACAQNALRTAGLRPSDIGCLAAQACGEDRIDRQEITGLCAVYTGEPNRIVLTSSQSQTGTLDEVNGLVGLVKTGLCLANRLRPGVKDWTGPKFPELWSNSNFYVPVDSLTWFQKEICCQP